MHMGHLSVRDLPRNTHPARIGARARHSILLAQSLIFLIAAPELSLSQTAGPEPMAPQIAAPPDQVPSFLPEKNPEPIASDQKSVPLAKAIEEPVRPVTTPSKSRDEVKSYLWSVYQRSSTKTDSHGDFTWKDAVVANVWGLSMEDYVVGGMDPDFRELLFAAGRAMDAAGIDWSILSGFRDDFRQSLAAGLKAQGGNSFHGGSVATGGYTHGCAADLASSDGLSDDRVWSWLDRHGQQFGLYRPLPGKDPAHVQPTLRWRPLAVRLRDGRRAAAAEFDEETVAGTETDSISPGDANAHSLSEEQLNCSHVRHSASAKEIHGAVARTRGSRAVEAKRPYTHPHEETAAADDRSRSSSRSRSAQAKGHNTRGHRADRNEAGLVFAESSTTSP
jgi:hypothetical protein